MIFIFEAKKLAPTTHQSSFSHNELIFLCGQGTIDALPTGLKRNIFFLQNIVKHRILVAINLT